MSVSNPNSRSRYLVTDFDEISTSKRLNRHSKQSVALWIGSFHSQNSFDDLMVMTLFNKNEFLPGHAQILRLFSPASHSNSNGAFTQSTPGFPPERIPHEQSSVPPMPQNMVRNLHQRPILPLFWFVFCSVQLRCSVGKLPPMNQRMLPSYF